MIPTTADAFRLLMEGSQALAVMEHNGIRIDVGYLDNAISDVENKIREMTDSLRKDEVYSVWRKRYGKRANLDSGQQLAEVIFNKLKYKKPGKTRTGKLLTDESAFQHVDLPFIKTYFQLKKLKKSKGTYLDGIKRETQDGYLHPVFNLHTVQTYRSSGSDPNVQNLPVRDPFIGKMIRKSFIPRKGRVLIEADYGSLEFRIAASVWKDSSMVSYASDPDKDVHRDQAMECYLLKRDEVSKNSRYCSKNKFVFPIIYGSYYVSCARDLWAAIDQLNLKVEGSNLPMKEHLRSKGIKSLGRLDPYEKPKPGTYEYLIKEVEQNFDKKFPTFGREKVKWWNAYLKRGWFQMVTGFVVKGVYSRNFLMNAPIQGPGFHCLLWSIIQIQKEIKKRKMKSLLVAQIHDCILADVPHNEVQDFLHLVKRVMTEDIKKAWSWVITRMDVEADIVQEDSSWFDKKPWVLKDGVWSPK